MWANELTRQYTSTAATSGATGSAFGHPVEASRLLLKAAGHLLLEQTNEGLRLAEQALTAFRQGGDSHGLADAARLVTQAMCLQDRRKEADRLLRDELGVFQTSAAYGSKAAEVRLLLACAEVNSDRRGQKKREEALKTAGQARSLAVELADVGLEATSLTVMSKIFIKYRGDKNACSKEAYRLGMQALELFTQIDDTRGQAIATHWCAVAQNALDEKVVALRLQIDAAEKWNRAEDLIMEANSQCTIAEWGIPLGFTHEAAAAAEKSLASFLALGFTGSRELRALRCVVNASVANGEPWRAIWTAEEAVARYRESRTKANEAYALLLLAEGYIHSPSGRAETEAPPNPLQKPKPPPQEAVAATQKALKIARELNDSVLEAQVMTKLSTMHVKRTEMEEAIFAAHDALSHREVKDPDGKGLAFRSLASAHLHKKEYETAERAAMAARDICRKDGRWHGDAKSLLSLAEVLLAEQKFEESADVAKEAQALSHQHGDRHGEARALRHVAKLRAGRKEYERALHAGERARELFQRVGDAIGECEVLVTIAECRTQLLQKQQQLSTAKLKATRKLGGQQSVAPLPWEELSKATQVSKQASEAAKKVGDVQAEAAALCVMAQIHVFNGRPREEILATLDEAMMLAVEAGDSGSEGKALLLTAEFHLEAQELQSALKAARQAELLFKRLGDEQGKARVDEILNTLRGHEFRVDGVAQRFAAAPGQAALMPQMPVGPDPSVVRATIQEVAKGMVGSENDLEDDMPLMDIGINSMNAVLFRNKLTSEFPGLELPSTLVFDFPTVRALSSLAVEQATAAAVAANAAAMAARVPVGPQVATTGAAPGLDVSVVRSKLQEVTKGMVGSDGDIDADMPLMDIGINSMNAVLFRNKLGSTFEGVELPSTLVFDFPTIRSMSELLSEQLG